MVKSTSGKGGKGSQYRPVNRKKYEENFDRIFKDKKKKTNKE